MANIDEEIKKEWRDLGFYYELEEYNEFKQWKFYGSKKGLFNLIKLLENYTAKKSNDYISEHDHYGPYSYLKIIAINFNFNHGSNQSTIYLSHKIPSWYCV